MRFLHKPKSLSLALYWMPAMLYWEALAHAGMFEAFHGSFRFALGFSAGIALILAFAVQLLPKRALFPVSLLLTAGLTLLYGSQMVYCFIFGTPYSVSQMGMGADAVTQFQAELLSTMGDRFAWILALLVPFFLLIALRCLVPPEKPKFIWHFVQLWLGVMLICLTLFGIRMGGTAMYSDYYFLTNTRSTTAQVAERFGVPATFCLELTHTRESEEEQLLVITSTPTEPEQEEAEEKPITYNVMDVDFDALNDSTGKKDLLALNSYFSQISPTKQNEYTGFLKDYNLILICAESYSPAAVDPVLTPTLYKLSHEGFLFRNYYNSFPNTTIDGEYTLTQGLYPDASRGKHDSSMLASATHYLPFTLGNAFMEQRDIHSWGYHNNIGSYYKRNCSHPNMGYSMKFNHSGMEMTGDWPTSDYEMMVQSVDDYIHEEQFHAYYMTFSGHYQYKPSINGIAAANFDRVKNLDGLDMEQKAYLSCHIELDKALEYLLMRLEEAGIADKTAIVLAADHIPYGLTKSAYFGLLNETPDFFKRYKSDLIFWVGGMAEPIEVEPYCCNVDVLPTLLNLWGLTYDSRMLAGTDIFSDSPHAAVLIDRSFLTDKVWFDSNTCEIRYQVDAEQVDEDYVENMNQLIASRFKFSSDVLKTDYYRFAFNK